MTSKPPENQIVGKLSLRDRAEIWAQGRVNVYPKIFAKCCAIAGMLAGAVAGYFVDGLFGSAISAVSLAFLGGVLGLLCEQHFRGAVLLGVMFVCPRSSARTLAILSAVATLGGLIQVWIRERTVSMFLISFIVYALMLFLAAECIATTRKAYARRTSSRK